MLVCPRRREEVARDELVVKLPQGQAEPLGSVLTNDPVRLVDQIGLLGAERDALVLDLRHSRLYNPNFELYLAEIFRPRKISLVI